MGMDRNIHGKKSDAKISAKNRKKSDFSASALHVPGSASGGENVADLLAIN